MKDWYSIENIENIDSPSIVLYKEHLMYNLNKMISMVNGNTSLLMPHVKTNKMPKVISIMISLGIKNFKASTIAEAEIVAVEGADTVLIAHQLVGPKIKRFCMLSQHFPNTTFSTIVDNIDSIKELNEEAMKLHVYDGHLKDTDFKIRKRKIESELEAVNTLFDLLKQTNPDIKLICGGTPSFSSHITESHRITSPGTCVLWDWGYSMKLKEQEFKYAALLICRVIIF